MSTLYDIFLRHPQVATDSRQIAVGAMFFALSGTSFDGNRFAVQAIEQGASYAICDNPQVVEDLPGAQALIDKGRIIFVDDALSAMQQLASEYRQSWNFPVLAITGTNGKTTTKELVSAVLAQKFKVHSTKGNFNNHIGVPLTILSAPLDTNFAVIEMGASACGEIAVLCEIAAPGYGIITNIGRAHLDGFGDEQGVIKGKGELYDYLAARSGTVFYCDSNERLRTMVLSRSGLNSITYDSSSALGIESQLRGDYNKYNIAAAVVVGKYFGVSDNEMSRAISSYVPDNNRSQVVNTPNNMIIVDCYNANPSSMAAAISSFGSDDVEQSKIAILGDMLELGEFSQTEHQSVIESAGGTDIGELWLVGPNFMKADSTVVDGGQSIVMFADIDALAEYIKANPVSGKSILLKGSRGVGLERILPLL